MARITARAWSNYIGILRRISDRATKEMLAMVTKLSNQYNEGVITLCSLQIASKSIALFVIFAKTDIVKATIFAL